MKNKNIISPIGLKGKEINERMKQLMGISPINENKSNIVVELTKMGPDGKAYAIIRENHEYYIKTTTKTSGLIAEDFQYIGGLQNKKEQAYPSYAKAIKHLNLRFNSLSEAYNSEEKINTFLDDNLISENGFSGGFVDMPKGGGFAENVYEEETQDNSASIGNRAEIDANGNKIIDANDFKILRAKKDDELDEIHQAVENMLDETWMEEEEMGMGEEPQRPTLSNARNQDEWFEALDGATAKEVLRSLYDELGRPVVDAAKRVAMGVAKKVGGPGFRDDLNQRYPENEGSLYEGKLSINKAIDQMDALIDGLSDSKKKVKTQK